MFFMGKFTISTGPFSIAMLNYQRVDFDTSKKGQKSGIFRYFSFTGGDTKYVLLFRVLQPHVICIAVFEW